MCTPHPHITHIGWTRWWPTFLILPESEASLFHTVSSKKASAT